jgi:2-succinyl-6-hydroxy-2,4-cyclohexadiene-1-carboxylate synthase
MRHAAPPELVGEGAQQEVGVGWHGAEVAEHVLLHGFGGTHRAWDRVAARLGAERYLAPDLRGHGVARDGRPVTFEACVADVLAAAPERFALCGYSMGGRVALHVALAAPERVERLVLVSATAGIDDAGERAARRASDAALAERLERDGLEAFVATWRGQPLFAGDPAWVTAEAQADQRRNDAAGLAAVLRGMGTGSMAPLWHRLGELAMPAVVLVGERDTKFRELGERLRDGLPDARLDIAADAGHSIQLEAPGAVVHALSG